MSLITCWRRKCRIISLLRSINHCEVSAAAGVFVIVIFGVYKRGFAISTNEYLVYHAIVGYTIGTGAENYL